MKKRFSVIFLLLTIMVSSFGFGAVNVFATTNKTESNCKSAYLMDYNTNTCIYSKNENEKLPIASMTKIMTLLLCFENIDNKVISYDDDVLVSENASGMGGSQVFLESNANYKVKELIKSIVVASANDACVAMAEKLYGSESDFVDKMNEKAVSLGMKDTCFVNCTGLPKLGQYSTAKDVATMFSALISHKDYFEFSSIWMDEIHHPKDRITGISNTNKLIRFYDGCDGGKTGYTSEAGHCLCATANKNGLRLISVVIKANDSKSRFKETSDMFNYGFNNFESKLIIDANKPLDVSLNVDNGKKETLTVIPEKDLYVLENKRDRKNISIDLDLQSIINAPVKKGDVLGVITVYENGINIASVNVLSNEDVSKAGYFDNVLSIMDKWSLL